MRMLAETLGMTWKPVRLRFYCIYYIYRALSCVRYDLSCLVA